MDNQLLKAISILLAILVGFTCITCISAGVIALLKSSADPVVQVAPGSQSATPGVQPTAAPAAQGTPSPGSAQTTASASPAASATSPQSSSGTTSASSGSNADTTSAAEPTSPAASSEKPETKAQIIEYFNTVINRVKPEAKKVTLNREFNSLVSELKLDSSFLESLANPLVENNMGEKELTDDIKYGETLEAKNKIFPVENETWASQLTEANVKDASIAEDNGVYTIVVYTNDDEPNPGSGHGVGNNGQVFSVIPAETITANAGAAAGLISDVKTGFANGRITITVDKATGHVLTANYYFDWSLNLVADAKIITKAVSVTFGLEKDFSIDW